MTNKFAIISVLTLVALSAVVVSAQPAGYFEIPIKRQSATDPLYCQPNSTTPTAKPEFKITKRESCEQDVASLSVDHESEALIYWSASSDCKMTVQLKAIRSDQEKRVRLIVNNIYGGCKASGRRGGWVVIEKPPTDYQISIDEVRVDRIHADDQDDAGEFQYPKPPTEYKRVAQIAIREVDIAGCLTLVGQSRWIISNQKTLTTAMDRSADPARCSEHFRTLGIDLSRDVLIGVSFASGYCDRPDGLEVSAQAMFAVEPRDDLVIVSTSHLQVPKSAKCEKWTTYPIWLVLQRSAPNVRIRFEHKINPNEPG